MEDVNTRQRLSFSFLELQYSLKEFNSRKICQQLGTSLPRSRFLDVTQRENARTGALRDIQKTAARETSWGHERDGIGAINLEAARIHFSLSDVFVAVAVVVAWAS